MNSKVQIVLGLLMVAGTAVLLQKKDSIKLGILRNFFIAGLAVSTLMGTAIFSRGCAKIQLESNIDEVELAKTTKLQEAFLIDFAKYDPEKAYKLSKKNNSDELMKYLNQGEMGKIIQDPNFNPSNFSRDLQDLVDRGIFEKTKMSKKELDGGAYVSSNAYLTSKGKKLVQDLMYIRNHPGIKVSRPVEN